MVTKSEIEFALLKQETVTTPIVLPSSLKEIKSLIFQHQNQQSEATNFLPLPDLVSAPKMLVPLENEVAIPSIIEKLVILSDEIYKPKSCASKGISISVQMIYMAMHIHKLSFSYEFFVIKKCSHVLICLN